MHRVEVRLNPRLPDARGLGLVKDISDLGITTVSDVRVVDIYWLDGDLTPDELDLVGQRLLADLVTQEYQCFTLSTAGDGSLPWPSSALDAQDKGSDRQSHVIEVTYNPGVTDPVEGTVMKAIRDLGVEGVSAVKTAKRYLLQGRLNRDEVETICSRLLVNPIIQHVFEPGQPVFFETLQYDFKLNQVNMLEMDPAGLRGVRQQFGFSDDELKAIVAYFRRQGRNPVDAELETLAQTWSEHCVHKTFKGKIKLGEVTIDNLLKSTVMKATAELDKPWCLSVFEDNAGVIDFDGRYALCFKVETHNHPSAVEPYGGAATGIGGVVRDPLGTGLGAKPILNTDVFCFAPPDLPYEKLPEGVLHPRRACLLYHAPIDAVFRKGTFHGISRVRDAWRHGVTG